jgi:chemotaxis protein MotB
MFEDNDPLQGEMQQDELWLISYADMLTLLIGFFALIVASVPLRRASFERIAAALSGSGKAAPLEELRDKVDKLVERSPELKNRVRTSNDAEGLGIEFKDALLFDSGSASLRPEARPAVDEIARLIQALPARPVTIEGHTDDVPISTREFNSNWELSSQRAINVLSALQAAGVERERMSARAMAETHPLPTQGTIEQRRSANRRVVIRVE